MKLFSIRRVVGFRWFVCFERVSLTVLLGLGLQACGGGQAPSPTVPAPQTDGQTEGTRKGQYLERNLPLLEEPLSAVGADGAETVLPIFPSGEAGKPVFAVPDLLVWARTRAGLPEAGVVIDKSSRDWTGLFTFSLHRGFTPDAQRVLGEASERFGSYQRPRIDEHSVRWAEAPNFTVPGAIFDGLPYPFVRPIRDPEDSDIGDNFVLTDSGARLFFSLTYSGKKFSQMIRVFYCMNIPGLSRSFIQEDPVTKVKILDRGLIEREICVSLSDLDELASQIKTTE